MLNRFFNWIDSKYNKKVNLEIIAVLFVLGVFLQYMSSIMQIILIVLMLIVMLLFLISAVRQKKRMSEIIMNIAGFLLYIFIIINRIIYNNSLSFILSLIGSFICAAIIFTAAIKNAFEGSDKERIRKVKIGIIFLFIAIASAIVVVLMVLFD